MNHPHRLLATSAIIGLAILASSLIAFAAAASAPTSDDAAKSVPKQIVLTGQAAFTDAAHEAPGTRRHLTAADLPGPMPEPRPVPTPDPTPPPDPGPVPAADLPRRPRHGGQRREPDCELDRCGEPRELQGTEDEHAGRGLVVDRAGGAHALPGAGHAVLGR